MKKFKQFDTSANDDGSVNILKVPIFKMGMHKGTDFNDELVDEIIGNHESLKTDEDYFSSVIIGHNEKGQDEKDAEGFMDNLLKDEGIVYADIVKVPRDTFNDSFKKRKYPHRSVEYNPAKKVFSALALLGGTSPHHKLPILEFANDDEHVRIDFSEIKSLLTEDVELLGNEANQFKEELDMKKFSDEEKQSFLDEQNLRFKEEHGVSPEEAVALNKKYQDDQGKAESAARAQKIKSFADKLKANDGLRVVPALVDDMIIPFMESLPVSAEPLKFKDGDEEKDVPQLDFFENLVEKAVTMAADGELQVEYQEQTEGIEHDGAVNKNDPEKIDQKATKMAKKYQEDGKFESFAEAYDFAVDEIYEKL